MEAVQQDDRFKSIPYDRKYKKISTKVSKVAIDQRFQGMFTDEKFKIKGTKDKRGRNIVATSNEDMKRYYKIEEDETTKDVNVIDQHAKMELESESDSERESFNADHTDTTTDTDISESEGEELIEHKWGELDNDCEDIIEATNRLAVCNLSWDVVSAKDLYLLFDSVKPLNGLVKDVKIYRSEYGKKMKAEEDAKGPFAVMNILNRHKKSHESELNSHDDLSDKEENFDTEKLRQYQINTMKYAYAIVELDSVETAQHIYMECNGFEFEKTSNIVDLRYVPDDTTFNDAPASDILSHFDFQMSILNIPTIKKAKNSSNQNSKNIGIMNGAATKCLSQTKIDLSWDQTDPQREFLLQKSLAPLYNDNVHMDRVGKSRNKLKKQAKSELLEKLMPGTEINHISNNNPMSDGEMSEEFGDLVDYSDHVKRKAKKSDQAGIIDHYLASPSSSSANDQESECDLDDRKDVCNNEVTKSGGTASKDKHGQEKVDKYTKYRQLLAEVLKGNKLKSMDGDLDGTNNANFGANLAEPSDQSFDDEFFDNGGDEGKSETKKGEQVMEITWQPDLSEVTREKVEKKLEKLGAKEKSSETGEGPWEKYLSKDRAKKQVRKREKMMKKSQLTVNGDGGMDENNKTSDNEYSNDEILNNSNQQAKADLELLMMSDDDILSSRQHPFYRNSNNNQTPDQIESDIKRPKKKLKKRKTTMTNKLLNEEDDFELNIQDTRFIAMKKDPQFALDPSHPMYKTSASALQKLSTTAHHHEYTKNKKFKKYKHKGPA